MTAQAHKNSAATAYKWRKRNGVGTAQEQGPKEQHPHHSLQMWAVCNYALIVATRDDCH